MPVKEDTVNKWLSIFSWLFILNLGKRQDGEHPRGVCNLCKAAVKDRVIKPVKGWTDPSGATLFDGNACLTHAMSNGHQRAVDHASNRQDQQRSWNNMASAAAKRVSELGIICVITAAWMLGNNIPIHKFAQLLLLYKAHGFVALDCKYNHSRYVWAAMRALSEAIMASMLAVVVSSPVFALLFDLSSDVGNEEHMLVYIRCVNTVTLMPVTMFLCCVRVMGKRGVDMAQTVQTICQHLGLDYVNKLVAVCTDGDSANMGRFQGCITILKGPCKYLSLSVHCAAHVSNLVMVCAQKHSLLLQGVDNVCRGAHKLLSRKTGMFRSWQKFCSKHHITGCKFPMFNSTRWFSRAHCVNFLQARFPVLLVFMYARCRIKQWPQAQALMVQLCCVRVAFMLYVTRDLLAPLEATRKAFESDACRVSQVKGLVQRAASTIKVQFVEPLSAAGASVLAAGVGGEHVQQFREGFDSDTSTLTLSVGRHSLVVPLTGALDDEFRVALHGLAVGIVEGLNERFESAVLDVLESFAVLEPESYVGLTKDAMRSFTGTKFTALVRFFGEGEHRLFDKEEVRGGRAVKDALVAEFRVVREVLFEYAQQHYNHATGNFLGSLQQAWVAVQSRLQAGGNSFSHEMRQLLHVYLITPVSTALVERGFSQHRATKTTSRNRLQVFNVDSIMRVWHHFAGGASSAAWEQQLVGFAQQQSPADTAFMAGCQAVLAQALGSGSILSSSSASTQAAVAADPLLGKRLQNLHQAILGLHDSEFERLMQEEEEFWEGAGGVLSLGGSGGAGSDTDSDAGSDDGSIDLQAIPEEGDDATAAEGAAAGMPRLRRSQRAAAATARGFINAAAAALQQDHEEDEFEGI